MRRFQIPCAALVAGLAVLLSGCAGETPTAPTPPSGPGAGSNGPCSTVISLSASTVNPVTASAVRATVTKAGVPVANGSVQFTTDLGFFGENGLQTISKTIVDGVADVSVFSSFGTAHVIAVFDCAKAQLNLQFSGAPTVGPFISSISPTTGSCAGGDTITILGGRFTGTIDVTFGGVSGSIVSSTATQIIVKSPARTLRDPAVPETVPLVVSAGGVLSPSVPFTFVGIDPLQKAFITSLSSTGGASAGNDTVTINGGHFGANIATTRVTFCGRPAQITAQTDQTITVSTPASPAALEVCDVVVTRDIGLCSQQSATSPQQFTFSLVLTPVIFSISPVTGPNDATTRVTIFGTGFQFPIQVFLTVGACGGVVEAEVSDILLTTIVFKTPLANGPNACLAGALAGISIKNPSTGKTATSPVSFQYFAVLPTPTPTPAATPTPTPVPPTIITTILPNGEVGVAYSASLLASAGSPPFTWTLQGALPTGLTLSGAGLISGTPTVATPNPVQFGVTVRDSRGGTSPTSVLSITIIAAPAIQTASPLANATNNTPYAPVTLAATGGTGSFTWAIAAGALPTGLTLSAGGVISGTPAVVVVLPATFNFTVRATDTVGGTVTKAFSITVN
jgi:large repetitive protein